MGMDVPSDVGFMGYTWLQANVAGTTAYQITVILFFSEL